MLGQNRLRIFYTFYAAIVLLLSMSCIEAYADEAQPDKSIDAKVGRPRTSVISVGSDPQKIDYVASLTQAPGADNKADVTLVGGRPPYRGGPSAADAASANLPGYCRHDDYMYLPPNATAGLPCAGSVTVAADSLDPRAWAAVMEGQLPLPDLTIKMNPRLGLVRLPTWFWVDGYDGGIRSNGGTIEVRRTECHSEAVRDGGGDAVLDGGGAPQTTNVCATKTDALMVEVRLFPTHYLWDFGDGATQAVRCGGDPGSCRGGLGDPYQDATHPSSIAHPYTRSSLHVGGAYTVTLAIAFAAEYRFRLDDAPLSGWAALDTRHPVWSASHPVQEAQAVLTRQ